MKAARDEPSLRGGRGGLLKGNYPIVATAWTDDGQFDRTSQARLIDWLIDSGVHGLVMLANASEGHAQSDAEKAAMLEFGLKRVAGRVPVIATVTHFAAEVASENARRAEALGAAAVMSMPPFFGTWGSDPGSILSYFDRLARAVTIPVMVQDHVISGVPMSAELQGRMIREIENLRYFKIEFTHSPSKIARLLELAGGKPVGLFGGTCGVYLLDEYARGGRGVMPACYMPRVFSEAFRLLEAGETDEAYRFFVPYLPLLHFELRNAERGVWKCILKRLGVIASERSRGPLPPHWDEGARRQLFDHVDRVGAENFGVPVKSLRRRLTRHRTAASSA